MSKHEDFKAIIDDIADLNLLELLWRNIDDKEAEKKSLLLIHLLRQYIERLRRIVDDGEEAQRQKEQKRKTNKARGEE